MLTILNIADGEPTRSYSRLQLQTAMHSCLLQKCSTTKASARSAVPEPSLRYKTKNNGKPYNYRGRRPYLTDAEENGILRQLLTSSSFCILHIHIPAVNWFQFLLQDIFGLKCALPHRVL